jgi:MFS family permease
VRVRVGRPGRIRSIAGGLHPAFWTLWVGTLINRVGSVVLPFLAIHLTDGLGFSAAQAGAVVAVIGLGSVIAGPLGGALADRIGRRPALVGGLVAGGASMLLLGSCREPVEVVAVAFVLGVAGDLYRPAFFAAVADVVPPEDRPRAYGLLYWVLNVGFAVALPIAGVLAVYSPRLLFVVDAASTFAFAFVMWRWLPETLPPGARAAREPRSTLASVLTPLRDPAFLALQVPFFATALVLMQSQVALSIDLTARGMSPAAFGLLLSFNGILIVLAQPMILPLVGRLARSVALATGALLIGLGFGLHTLSWSVPLALMAVAVWTAGDMVQQSVLPAVIADIAPAELRASYEGASFMVWGLAGCAAPALGGQVLTHHGGNVLWLSCALLGLAAAACYLSSRRLARARAAARATEEA